ncbi:MAG: RNase adapter RapZ [Bacteroidales bacterium]|nr:RNase adapter RapZ [Bacteroidales bacterium]
MNTELKKKIEKSLSGLFEQFYNESPITIEPLPASGSYRIYYRLENENKSAIGVYNEDSKENTAFINFTKHFLNKKLNVPEIYAEDLSNSVYLLEDLGDTTLFSFLTENRNGKEWKQEFTDVYKKVIDVLPLFQINAGKDIDYKYCYPRGSFDKQSMLWDLNYFKYYFLKLSKVSFDEQKLENDFEIFANYLLEADSNFFLYRDFQSRNIMLVEGKPYFVDYQGGRKGALQYDLASLLYDAKADIPQNVRNELTDYYIKVLSSYISVDAGKFKNYFFGFVFIRIMQALGAYGFRGFYERKEHFLASIPFAIDNIVWLINNTSLPLEIPELKKCWEKIVKSTYLNKTGQTDNKLTIRIQSFSYKNGIPGDDKGNGGGFVFDCRALPNPGRLIEFKTLTGKDSEVIEFLEKYEEVKIFLRNVFSIVDMSVENYKKRNFADLLVTFGCTGGQHRSVYCANILAKHLKEKYDINIVVKHNEVG